MARVTMIEPTSTVGFSERAHFGETDSWASNESRVPTWSSVAAGKLGDIVDLANYPVMGGFGGFMAGGFAGALSGGRISTRRAPVIGLVAGALGGVAMLTYTRLGGVSRPADPEQLAAAESVVQVRRGILPSAGSGWFIDKDLVVTNSHVAGDGDALRIRLPNDNFTTHPATLLYNDPATDVAIIHVDGTSGMPLQMAEGIPLGNNFVAVGYGYGRGLDSEVASVGDDWDATDVDYKGSNGTVTFRDNLVHTSAAVGYSGGPVLDDGGRVIGMIQGGAKGSGVYLVQNSTIRNAFARARTSSH